MCATDGALPTGERDMGPADSGIDDGVIHAALEDGTPVCIRAIRPADESLMRNGIARLSAESRYLRFFSVQPMPPDTVIRGLLNADGRRHIAWGAIAVDQPGKPAIGAVHAVREAAHDPSAEFSVAIVDAYQGLGLARMLVAVLLTHCRVEGIATLEVQILAQNDAARGLVTSLGAEQCGSESGVGEYALDVGMALETLTEHATSPGLRAVLGALSRDR